MLELTDPALVTRAVAAALGLREAPDHPLLDTLLDALAARPLLFVWDNCDYVVEECRTLAQSLLGNCPQVRILATSRRSLHVPGEVLYAVPPLPVPEAGAGARERTGPEELLESHAGLQLFRQRAREKLATFELTSDNLGAVVQVCRRLDGIPLAL